MFAFTVWMTERCNMRCSYCYENDKIDRMSQSVIDIRNIINFIENRVKNAAKKEDVIVNLHGGEPLLEFDKLVYFVEGVKEKLKDYNVYFKTVTNGTLLNKEKALWLNTHINYISVSMDGGEAVHNKNRRYSNGKGTYLDIINNLLESGLNKDKLRIRMTVDANTVYHLADSISHLADLGFRIIVPCVVYEDKGWDQAALNQLEQALMQMKWKYRNHSGIKIAMTNFEEIKMKGYCNGGIGRFDIMPNGDLYPCSYVAGIEEFKLGNVQEDLRIDTDQLYSLYHTGNEECKGCTYTNYCIATRCKYLNKINSGDYHLPTDLICHIENIRYRVCSSMVDKQSL